MKLCPKGCDAFLENDDKESKMQCKLCSSDDVDYVGTEHYEGDFENSLCDKWHCAHCDFFFLTNCVEDEDLEEPGKDLRS
jgi:hypothetical protein